MLRPAEHIAGAGVSPRTVALAKILAVVDLAEASPDLWSERWSKLCLNAMSNTPQAMSGLAGPEVNHTAEGRRLTITAAGETVRVGVAKGLTIGKVRRLRKFPVYANRDLLHQNRKDKQTVSGHRESVLSKVSLPVCQGGARALKISFGLLPSASIQRASTQG